MRMSDSIQVVVQADGSETELTGKKYSISYKHSLVLKIKLMKNKYI